MPLAEDVPAKVELYAGSTQVPVAYTGVPGQAPARGLGGFVPDPANNPYAPGVDEVNSHYVDVEGSLVTRGKIFTDEGSFRDDFTGTFLTSSLSGILQFTEGSAEVVGIGTTFTEELNRHNYIKLDIDGIPSWTQVQRVPSDDTLYLVSPYVGTSMSGSASKSRWILSSSGLPNEGLNVVSSSVILSPGTGSTDRVSIYRVADYSPITSVWTLSVSQRINNQTFFFGFRDDPSDPLHYADVVMTGTDNTKLTFRSAWNGDAQQTTVTLPTGMRTHLGLRYKIDLNVEYCSLEVNGVLVAKHEDHIPDMYAAQDLCCGFINSGMVTATSASLDTVLFADQNQVQIASLFQAPMPVVVREDQHTLIGKLVTTSTTADQVVVSYTVPNDKVCYLIGYRVDCEGTAAASPVKIGKTTLGNEPTSPGTIDGNIFRAFNLAAGASTGEIDFGANPRKLGSAGDTIVVAVTPNGILSTTWHAALDIVLR
jgi:hypothetical protein